MESDTRGVPKRAPTRSPRPLVPLQLIVATSIYPKAILAVWHSTASLRKVVAPEENDAVAF